MPQSPEIRIAILETEVRGLKVSVEQLDKKLDSILDTLAQMSGGKKAILGLFALLGGFIGAGAAVISAVLSYLSRGAGH